MLKINNFRTSFSTLSLAYVLLGLFLLLFPTVSTKIICAILGVVFVVLGVIRLINYFRSQNEVVLLRTGFISGFLLTVIGLFFIFKPTLVTSILPFVIGLLICFNGIVKLQSAFELRRVAYQKWLLPFVIALLTLVVGLILIINPFSGVKLAVMFIGGALIVDGLTNLFTMRTVRHNVGDAMDYLDIE